MAVLSGSKDHFKLKLVFFHDLDGKKIPAASFWPPTNLKFGFLSKKFSNEPFLGHCDILIDSVEKLDTRCPTFDPRNIFIHRHSSIFLPSFTYTLLSYLCFASQMALQRLYLNSSLFTSTVTSQTCWSA